MDRQTAGLGRDTLSAVYLFRRQDARLAKNDPIVKGRDERLRRPWQSSRFSLQCNQEVENRPLENTIFRTLLLHTFGVYTKFGIEPEILFFADKQHRQKHTNSIKKYSDISL